ncbi:Chromosome partition protein Smc [Corynebacterium ciconiae DSM 44920]|uniref:chromosome segregation protein SMC n=1 Tax=Corynebacterium ciconiae TaxID=227319 RepID=UPI0003A06011|nr:chromosome segregation protein SMC [Corynebacterium ciconiae]WKD61502.1 Chromosome partition protein Smc [Corynebacterium ciconiae DSM 44920]
MYLKSLTMKGFKSFASATTMKFEPGICAVVGPNGSGKSNVVDALAWVMGEQGAKSLRGGKMDDVIFAGAGGRKPLGRAEVTLTIDNSDGAISIDYTEVSITRRMFRDGASEYEINGSRARLMDIQELLSDSGIGKEMHIIVGQGKLAEILESRPEERRSYIEEAAGVLKHRRRKEKAQRKLVGMQANLDRLRDLTDELGKQLTPLARQAEAAQKAASVQARVRHNRLLLAGDTLTRRDGACADAELQHRRAIDAHARARAELDELQASAADWEAAVEEVTPQLEQAHNLWFELSSLAERVDATLRIARERTSRAAEEAYQGPDAAQLREKAELAEEEAYELSEEKEMAAAQLEEVSAELDTARENYERAEREHRRRIAAIADHQAGVARLGERVDSAEKTIAAAERRVAERQEQVRQAGASLHELEGQLAQAKKTLQSTTAQRAPLVDDARHARSEAEAAEQRLEEVSAEHRELDVAISRLESKVEVLRQQRPRASLAKDVAADYSQLAEHVRVDTAYAPALAAALGTHAEAWVGALPDAQLQSRLAEDNTEATAFIATGTSEPWRLDADTGGHPWLLDELELAPEVSSALTRMLVDVVIVPDSAAGRAVVEADPRLRAVTPAGAVMGHGWIITESGHGDGEAIGTSSVEIAQQISDTEARLASLVRRRDDMAGTLSGTKKAAEDARVNVAATTAALREFDAVDKTKAAEVDRLIKATDNQQREHQRLLEQLDRAATEVEQAREEYRTVSELLASAEDEDSPAEISTSDTDSLAAHVEQLRSMDTEARLRLAQLEQRENAALGRAAALKSQAMQAEQQRTQHEARVKKRQHDTRVAAAVAQLSERMSTRVAAARESVAAQREELEQRKASVVSSARRVRDQLSAATQNATRLGDARHEAEMALSTARVRLEESVAKLSEQTGLDAEILRSEYAPEPSFDRAATTRELKQAEKQLAALGKVNPLALEEYKALEERYDYLSSQLDDVEQARTDLEDVIDSVDDQILTLFTEAWKDVEAEFPKVFATLFPGGEGRLLLTNPADMLGTGIDVEARPPGKRVKRLSLLSGGEKSLTAVALLVAIFKARPSPFYVMDEVEAALDDVNLRRLIALFEDLRETSQLIVITHQKPTMDIANVLYGVTMRGDGVTQVLSQRMSPHSEPRSVDPAVAQPTE